MAVDLHQSPMKNSIANTEPHFTELLVMWDKNKDRLTKADIFQRWTKKIKPDVPVITVTQFINYTRNLNEREKDRKIQEEGSAIVDRIIKSNEASLVEIEGGIRSITGSLINDAHEIMKLNEEGGVPLKERYFALGIVDKIWGKVQKEKEIAIKAHAEKRESVGMFAKLLRGAMSGEFTMRDVENMKETYGHINQEPARIEGTPAGVN